MIIGLIGFKGSGKDTFAKTAANQYMMNPTPQIPVSVTNCMKGEK